jgi:hypothetical protein
VVTVRISVIRIFVVGTVGGVNDSDKSRILCGVYGYGRGYRRTTSYVGTNLDLVIRNPSSPHYRRALGASKGERLWRKRVESLADRAVRRY